jgi:hypothetical protein
VDAPEGAPRGQPAGSLPLPAPADRACAGCGAPMAASQDWCLQCGAGVGARAGSPGWRAAATIIGVSVLLALGAAAAGYAALNKTTRKPGTVTTAVAQAPPVTPATPAAPGATTPLIPGAKTPLIPGAKTPLIPGAKTPLIPGTKTPVIPGAKTPALPGVPTTIKPNLGALKGYKPPKIAPVNPSPQPALKLPAPTPSKTGGATTEPTPILLDTNAASTYNPYNYLASNFGDPSLTVDGDASTGWTAIVDPATAPKMAEGVLIDLKTRRRFASVRLTTSTPGMSVELYGANGKAAPNSIIDPAWVPLSRSRLIDKKHLTIKLRDSKRAFRFITLWISRAPAASLGTPQAPGHVSVNELELFAAQ